MRIFLIWLTIIACSVANGWFFSDFGSPEKFVFMFCALLVCVVVLFLHRKITKKWTKPSDPWTENLRLPIFRISTFISTFALIVLVIIPKFHLMEFVICLTIVITTFIASIRERKYTDDWI